MNIIALKPNQPLYLAAYLLKEKVVKNLQTLFFRMIFQIIVSTHSNKLFSQSCRLNEEHKVSLLDGRMEYAICFLFTCYIRNLQFLI